MARAADAEMLRSHQVAPKRKISKKMTMCGEKSGYRFIFVLAWKNETDFFDDVRMTRSSERRFRPATLSC